MSAKSKPEETFGCLILFVGGLFFFVLMAISSQERVDGVVEMARERGVEAGKEDGTAAGKVAGVNQLNADAYGSAYDKVIDQARTSGNYLLMPFYCFGIGLVSIGVGYAFQFSVFYVLRRLGVLQDVDRILLPKGGANADLSEAGSKP